MRFKVQFHRTKKEKLHRKWRRVQAEDHRGAAIAALNKVMQNIVEWKKCTVYVAKENEPMHPNGMPLQVHSFDMEWKEGA
ncbi:MAG: hypothetical protein CSYNP_01627 [Syntrophus sp. SKADARSKE-3]|nr:hypothetical protein [Syntrophus sp. SKADARSKE-3]